MLIAMAVHITDDNGKDEQTLATLKSLAWTVNWDRHRLFICDNSESEKALGVFREASQNIPFTLIRNDANIGTANAINLAWRRRKQGEHCVKMDNDVVIHQPEWVDWMEDVFNRDPTIGICGLKRKDLEACHWSTTARYRSTISMLSHERGQRWLVVEEVEHVIGTCQGYNSALLDKIGYLYQGNWKYGFISLLSAHRARLAKFRSVYLHGVEIDHIDPGDSEYTLQKQKIAADAVAWYNHTVSQYNNSKRSIYHDGGFKE